MLYFNKWSVFSLESKGIFSWSNIILLLLNEHILKSVFKTFDFIKVLSLFCKTSSVFKNFSFQFESIFETTSSITPSSTSSKILITVHQNGVDLRGGNSYIGLRIDKDGSTLKDFAALAARNNSASVDNAIGTVSMCYLDSPATTSSITYKTEFQNAGGATGIAYVQVVDLADNSTITLMEIGA